MFALGVILPATTRPANVPVLVIFGCAAVVNVPVKKLALTKLAPATLPTLKLPFNVTLLPLIVKLAEPSSTPELLN